MSWTRTDVYGVVAGALAAAIAPPEKISPSAWAAEHMTVPDGPFEGATWDPSLTPQLTEIMDQMAPESPANIVSLRKSAQLGATTIGMAWTGYVIDIDQAPFMTVLPTSDTAKGYNREKLHPTIEKSERLRFRVSGAKSRSRKASTALTKRFPGGSVILTGANSASDLSSKTRKYIYADEVDRWPLDIDGQGDPYEMALARMMSYRATGDWKILTTSTPTIKHSSRIDSVFEEGDKRFWMVICPHCGAEQRLEFGSGSSPAGLKFSTTFPFHAHYVCRENGCVIEHSQKAAMVRAGRWVATAAGPGKQPSYHLDTLTSLLVDWDDIAEAFLKAGKNPEKLKTFTNLWLGLPWEEKGDAPDWDRLFARRQDFTPGIVPYGGLVLTCGVDVQGNGLYYEVVAWGRGETSWVVQAGFLSGDTANRNAGAWLDLRLIRDAAWPMACGGSLMIDMMGVDSGYNTAAVYDFVRGNSRTRALKGVPEWTAPPLGTPTAKDVTAKGNKPKKRRGLQVWSVGTWPLKSKLYGFLRMKGIADGEAEDPPGYCHFGQFLDQRYFQQLTAEHIAKKEVKGRIRREWVAKGENHYHDCRIYNLALAWHLKVNQFDDDQWDDIARDREAVPDQADMISIMNQAPVHAPKPTDSAGTPETVSSYPAPDAGQADADRSAPAQPANRPQAAAEPTFIPSPFMGKS